MFRFLLEAEKPIAFDSPDHLTPHGTKRDNSKNWLFNRKLYALLRHKQLFILDIGCAGGGFVRTCIDDGHIAIGIEGSDYSKKIRRAEWGVIPDNLFTCDATAKFSFKAIDLDSNQEFHMQFNVITAWEFVEHIRSDDLPKVCDNVIRHLAKGGIWILSISPYEQIVNGVKFHQTVQNKDWWVDLFRSQGFTNHPDLVMYFGNDWIRGPLQGTPGSFHLVLTSGRDSAPELPPQSTAMRLNAMSTLVNTYRRLPSMLWRTLASSVPHPLKHVYHRVRPSSRDQK